VALNRPADPALRFDQVTLSFSLPVPLWNQNRAGIAAARHAAGQAHLAYRSVLIGWPAIGAVSCRTPDPCLTPAASAINVAVHPA
jgi:hypothetical protein